MDRTAWSKRIMQECCLCPRNCKVNRRKGQRGYCQETGELVVARAALHMWEETCISGKEGSGTVFFSGCNMGCVFCQNYSIARSKVGKPISVKRLARIFLELQEQGANNINLVTPTHYVPQITEALDMAKQEGLRLPIVYNTSGYEKTETIQMLKGYVDIYLPDFKYMEEELAKKYSHAPDYPAYAKEALEEMVSQVGSLKFDEKTGRMKRGVIVRHLVLPGHVKNAKAVIRYLYETYGERIMISIMNQYTPMEQVKDDPLLARKVTKREYERVVDYAMELGVECGFIQEGEVASESFIPEFDGEGV
ncbi:radical SAM protein [Bariatricus sp. SGI.154]|uniref:radical SAM protein n=1 Tax=Bariatricus sp. SGI.154 TaxID=3420549 RepID=UPI003D032C46